MFRPRWSRLQIATATLTFLLLPHIPFAQADGLPAAGTITIDFNSSSPDAVRYQPLAGPELVQRFAELSDISGSNRDAGKFAYVDPPNLLTFSGNGSCLPVGFTNQKDWVGCYKKGGIGTGRLVQGQTLTIGLDQTGPVAGKIVTSWDLRFTAKQNVVFQLDLDTHDGGTPETLIVYTGLAGIEAEGRGLLASERVCALAADSSPDSDAGCPVTGNEPWQTMDITVISDGALSLGEEDSTLVVSEFTGVILCGESTEEIFDPVTGITVQVWRLGDNYTDDGPPVTCERVPYSINFLGQSLELVVDYLDPPQTPQWEVKVTFAGRDITGLREVDISNAPDPEVDDRLQPYPTDGDDTIDARLPQATSQFLATDQEYYLDACFGNPNFDSVTGRLQSFDPPLDGMSNPDWPDQSAGVSGNQVACWFRQQDDLIRNPAPTAADGSSNLLEKTFWLFIRGDIRLRTL